MNTLCVIAAVLLASIHSTSAIECLSCTYTFAGAHGTYDRKCVSDVYNFTKTRVIECSDFCLTKAVYQTGYTRLNSLYRGCGYKREKFCDRPSLIIATCELTCLKDQCNELDGDLWSMMKPKPHPHHHGGGGGCGLLKPFQVYFLVVISGLIFLSLRTILT